MLAAQRSWSASQSRRPLLKLSVSVCLLVGSLLALPSVASAVTYELGSMQCLNGGLLRIYPPRSMTPVYDVSFRNPEIVRWSADLQKRYRTRRGRYRFRTVDNSRPFHEAFTSSYGYYQAPYQGAWRNMRTNAGTLFEPFGGLTRGIYRIKHWLYWGQLNETYTAVNSARCRFY